MNSAYNVAIAAGLASIMAVAAWLSVIDIREHRLPNRLVAPLSLAATLWVILLGWLTGDLGRSAWALAWGGAAVGLFFLAHLGAGLGMGDVKFAWPVGVTLGWFGWGSVRIGLIGMCITGALVALLVQRLRGNAEQGLSKTRRLPFGPFMTIGLVWGVLQAGFGV